MTIVPPYYRDHHHHYQYHFYSCYDEDEDEYYEWRPVDPDYYRNETPPGSDDDEGAEGADCADGGADTAVDPRPTWMRRKQRAAVSLF